MKMIKLTTSAAILGALLAVMQPASATVGMKIVAGASCAAAPATVPITTAGGTVALSMCVTTTASERVCGATFPLQSTNAAANAAAIQVTSRIATAPYTNVQDLTTPPVTLTSTSTNFAQSISPSGVQPGVTSANIKIADLTLTIPAGLPGGTSFTFNVDAGGEIGTVTGAADCNDIVNGTPVSNLPNSTPLTLATPLPPPTVSIAATTPAASESGTNGVVTFTRGGPTGATLNLTSVISGTAVNGTDYVISGGGGGACGIVSGTPGNPIVVQVPSAASSCTITITPINDTLVNGSRTAIFAPPTGPSVIPTGGSATVTIADNDAVPSVAITKSGACAEDAIVGPVLPVACQFTVAATSNTSPIQANGSNGPLVPYALSGSATFTTDYKLVAGTVTDANCAAAVALPQSGNVQTVFGTPQVYTICPVNDSLNEGTETVRMTLTAAATYAIVGPSFQDQNIGDDDSAQVVTIGAAGNPAEQGSVTGTFTVTRTGGDRLSKAAALPVNVTLSGSASFGASCVAGVDYTLSAPYASNVVTIPAAASSVVVTLTPCDDTVLDPSETAIMTIAAAGSLPAVQYSVGGAPANTASLTIIDNEVPVDAIAGNPGTTQNSSVPEGGTVAFSVSCPALAAPAMFTFTITPAVAAAGDTYSGALTGSVICPVGGASFVAIPTTVTTVNDTTIGNSRTYTMTLTGPTPGPIAIPSAAVLRNAVANVVVQDDDVPKTIPTIGAFGLALMGLLIAGFGGFVQRRRVK